MNTIEILKAARAKIENPANWTKGDYAKDADGNSLWESKWADQAPACMCSIGAVAVAANASICTTEKGEAVRFLDQAVGGSAGSCAIADFNDTHTHEEVLVAFDKAIELATNAQIVKNLEMLIAAVEAQPEEQFDLMKYKRETECGTAFCTAGLASTLPEFQAQGMEYRKEADLGMVYVNNVSIWRKGVADPMFGPSAFYRLFEPAGIGALDKNVLGYDDDSEKPNMTDKELALARLRNQLQTMNEIIAMKGEQA